MDNEQQMVNRILERFPYLERQISVHGSKRISSLPLTAKNFHEVFNYAITEEGFSTLNSIIGIDNGDQMVFVYALSDPGNTVFLIKLAVPAKEPAIKSVCSIFPGALFFEKELADMFGAIIENIPDKHVYSLPAGWPEGSNPLKKSWDPAFFDKNSLNYYGPSGHKKSQRTGGVQHE